MEAVGTHRDLKEEGNSTEGLSSLLNPASHSHPTPNTSSPLLTTTPLGAQARLEQELHLCMPAR